MEMIWDDLLQAYINSDGKIVEGIPEVDINKGVSYNKAFEVDQICGQDVVLSDVQEKAIAIERSIKNLKNQLKMLEESKKSAYQTMLNIMQQQDLWQIKIGDITISRTKEYERTTIDGARLREEMPDIAKLYENKTIVGESIKIKLGGTNND